MSTNHSTRHFQGFGMISVDNDDIRVLSNRQVELTFTVRSTYPQALDIVSKVASGMTGVYFMVKDRQKSIVKVRVRVDHPEEFTIVSPFVPDFLEALKTKINGVDKSKARRVGAWLF